MTRFPHVVLALTTLLSAPVESPAADLPGAAPVPFAMAISREPLAATVVSILVTSGLADSVIQALEKCWKEKVAVDDFVHKRLIYAYLYVDVLGERTSDGLSML